MKEKLAAIIKIIRPLNFAIVFISVIIAAVICLYGKFPLSIVFFAAISAALTMAAGNVINDIFDIDIDRINRPLRPLPSGKLSVRQAYVLYFIISLSSLIIALLIGLYPFLIVLLSHILLFLYSEYLKRVPLVGNLVVALLTGLVFIYGGIVVNNPFSAIIPAVFAFLINLVREIVKDMQDVEGDKKAGVISVPIKFGSSKSKFLVSLFTLILISFTLYPFITKLYKIEYFVIIMVSVNPIMVYVIKKIYTVYNEKSLKDISILLKASMILGLIAIYLGAQTAG